VSSPLIPYRTLPANLPEDYCLSTRYAFIYGNDGNPGAKKITENQYSLGADSDWSADTDNLIVRCTVHGLQELAPLFEVGGLAASNGELLIALEWTSSESCWRELSRPFALTKSLLFSGATAELVLELPAGSIRGNGLIAVQLISGNIGNEGLLIGLPSKTGSRLGQLIPSLEIIIDGDGSLFPILEESLDSTGPLWEIRSTWSDPRDEPFTSDYAALILNKDHELFDQLRGPITDPQRQSPLMRQVVSSWIALLVSQVKNDLGADFDAVMNHSGLTHDFSSIADAVAAFVRLGELDTGSLGALFSSTQRWFDRRIRDIEVSK